MSVTLAHVVKINREVQFVVYMDDMDTKISKEAHEQCTKRIKSPELE